MALAEVFEALAGPDAPVEFTAYDGSQAGQAGSPVKITVRSPAAVAYLAQAPGELGLARAYVAGQLDVEGDMYQALSRMTKAQSSSLTLAEKLRLLQALGGPKLLLHRMPPPPQEVTQTRRWLTGPLHSKTRDAKAISHHYDVSNRFYEWVLGPSMAYTCACYPREDASLEEAQANKFDLVARKLGLREGMRLLDVGCGWGGMVMHAAKEYGVKALGVTLSAQQAAWAQAAIEREGLSGLAEVRHLDYRDVPETGFDAVSSIGLTEHVGKQNLPSYFSFLYRKLKTGGRLLNHCITRPDNIEPAIRKRGFINRYVFPDGELEGPGYLISLMHDTGFEVRHEENLREHYAKTLAAWCANLDAHWSEAVQEVGQGTARVWRLYMAVAARVRPQPNPAAPGAGRAAGRRQVLRHAAATRLGAAPGASRLSYRTGRVSRSAAADRPGGAAGRAGFLRGAHPRYRSAGQRAPDISCPPPIPPSRALPSSPAFARQDGVRSVSAPAVNSGPEPGSAPRRALHRPCFRRQRRRDRHGRHAAALGGPGGEPVIRPRSGRHDQVGARGRLRHRLGEQHRAGDLPASSRAMSSSAVTRRPVIVEISRLRGGPKLVPANTLRSGAAHLAMPGSASGRSHPPSPRRAPRPRRRAPRRAGSAPGHPRWTRSAHASGAPRRR